MGNALKHRPQSLESEVKASLRKINFIKVLILICS